MLYHKQRNFRACRRVFDKYLAQRPRPELSRETCSMLGLSATAMGDIADGVAWYKQALEKDTGFKEAWLNLFQAYKEGGFVRARLLPAQLLACVLCLRAREMQH